MEVKNKKRNVSFEEYFLRIPDNIKVIYLSIRDLILKEFPFINEKIIANKQYFYFNNKRILYLSFEHDKVNLHLLNFHLEDKFNILSSKKVDSNSKEIKYIKFQSIKDTYNSNIRFYLENSTKFH